MAGCRYLASKQDVAEECQHRAVELLGSLQRCEMADTRKKDEFRMWNAAREIFGVFALDEFIMLALNNRDWHADFCQIIRRIIGLRSLHQADRSGKRVELVRRGR